jgi:hypothetical protein
MMRNRHTYTKFWSSSDHGASKSRLFVPELTGGPKLLIMKVWISALRSVLLQPIVQFPGAMRSEPDGPPEL